MYILNRNVDRDDLLYLGQLPYGVACSGIVYDEGYPYLIIFFFAAVDSCSASFTNVLVI